MKTSLTEPYLALKFGKEPADLIREGVAMGMSCRHMGEDLGVSSVTVWRLAKRYGIEMPNRRKRPRAGHLVPIQEEKAATAI